MCPAGPASQHPIAGAEFDRENLLTLEYLAELAQPLDIGLA